MKLKSVLAALSIAGLVSAATAAPLTYNVARNIGEGSVAGTITTDGSFGALTNPNVTAWALTLDDDTNMFNITQANSEFLVIGSGLSADIDFSMASTLFLFQNPAAGSGSKFWCGDGANVALEVCLSPSGSSENVNAGFAGVSSQRQGTNEIATRSVTVPPGNSVPEPASLALVGMALLGVAAVRRRA